MDDPLHCSGLFRAAVTSLVELIQTSTLRAIQEKNILSQLSNVTSAAADVERSWRYQFERERTLRGDLQREVVQFKTRLEQSEIEKSDLKRRLDATRATIELGKEERKKEELEQDARISRAIHARTEEVEKWKLEYTNQMKKMVTEKVVEARLAAQSEYRAILDASLSRLEREYVCRVEDRQRVALEAENRAITATQIAEALRLRLQSSQEIKSSFEMEKLSRQSAESQVVELRGLLQKEVEEGRRLRDVVDCERRAYKSMLDVRREENQLKHTKDQIKSNQDQVIEPSKDRVHLALLADVSFYKKKAEELAAKVVSIEALLKDLDRGIIAHIS